MSRADRGLEQLDYNTFNVRLGGLGGNPKDLGIKVDKRLFAPRLGLAYRINENTVFRAGYGKTFNPLPWSRPMRGFYPATIAYSDAGAEQLHPLRHARPRHPRRAEPGHRERQHPAAARRRRCARPIRTMSSAGARSRGTSFLERRLPLDIIGERRLRRHAHRRRLRRHQPELRRIRRQRQPAVLRAGRQRATSSTGRRARARATTRCRWRSTGRSRAGSCSRAPTPSARR